MAHSGGAGAMTGPQPEVSVIIVTWNGRQYLDACLRALAAQQGISFEIILVDNASTDGTIEFVRESFPSVRIVALDRNHGFAGGNNAGVREARGRFIALLNNDTVAAPDWLASLRRGIDAAARFELVTSRIVYMHAPDIIDSAGDGLLRSGGAFKRHHGRRAEVAGVSDEVFGICGGACLMPTRVFEELGGFDETFFISHEDVDLSYRARLRGYRCRYVADAIVRHHGSATLGTISSFAVLHAQRNTEWLYLKNTPGSLLLRTMPGHIVYNVLAAAHFARLGLLGTFIKAKLAALGGLPNVLRQRAAIQRSATVAAADIEPHLERRWLAAKLREKQFDMGLTEDPQ
jgi:GT2 family glycosyltransferase